MKKGFLAGVLTTLLVMSMIGSASATVAKVQKEIEYRNIKVSLDGEILDLRDAAGNVVEPFMFGGTNYIPARALAEALGLEVAWDGSNSTVVLTSKAQEEPADSTTYEEKLLFAKEHVRLYFLSMNSTSNGGYEAHFRIENDSDQKIYIVTRDTVIKGKNVSTGFNMTAEPGRSQEGTMIITKDLLSQNGIDVVNSIKTRFSVTGGKILEGGFSFESGNVTLSGK